MSVDSAELFQLDRPLQVADQTATPGNLIGLNDNDQDAFNTTCSDIGAAGVLTVVDSTRTSGDQWDVCDGTSLLWRYPTPSSTTTQALFATATAGAPAFRAIVDGDVPDTITASNYLPLIGGTLTGQVHIDNNQGLRLSEADGSGSNYVEQQVAARSDDIVLQWNVTPATCTGDGNGGVLTLNGTGPYTIDCEADDSGGAPDIDSVTGQTDWGSAATKTTNDLTVSGVEVDFESGASNAWPRLLNEATPTSGDCDAAGESGRLLFDPDDDTDGTVKVCRGAAGWKDIDDDGGGSTTGTSNLTWTINDDYSAAAEPEDGSGLAIDGGTGTDLTAKYDATGNDWEFKGASGGYSFDGKVTVAGNGNAEFVDQSSDCTDPASGSTSICTKAGKAQVRDTGGTTYQLVDVSGATMLGQLDFEAGASNAWPRLLNEATPTSTDCDAAGESGRLLFDPDDDTDGTVKVCRGAAGWKDIDDDGGVGGGDSITVNSSAATDPDFLNGDIDWTLSGGNSITATVACSGCVDATDLGTDAVAADELASTAIQSGDVGPEDVPATANPLTFTINAAEDGAEPDNGAGFQIEAGSGTNITMTYDSTGNDLEFKNASSGYYFDGQIAIAGTGNSSYADQSTACVDPASGSTSLCTIAGNAYVKDTGTTSRKLVDTSVAQKLGGVMFDFGAASIAITDEWAFRLKPYAQTVTRIECEAYSGTSFTIKVCKNEDLGDDTCTTNLLDSTESTTLVCDTTGASDTAINSGGIAARGEVSIVVTAVSGTVTKGEVYIEGTMDN